MQQHLEEPALFNVTSGESMDVQPTKRKQPDGFDLDEDEDQPESKKQRTKSEMLSRAQHLNGIAFDHAFVNVFSCSCRYGLRSQRTQSEVPGGCEAVL